MLPEGGVRGGVGPAHQRHDAVSDGAHARVHRRIVRSPFISPTPLYIRQRHGPVSYGYPPACTLPAPTSLRSIPPYKISYKYTC
eukprot:253778-Pyramimonas_sp.AAC.1